MAWIESHQELGRHPKTKKLARTLSIPLPQAVGHLQYFWWWALDFAQNGDLSVFDADELADASLWDSAPDVFLQALEAAGFIDNEDGHRSIHDWDDYAGRLLEMREDNKERSRERSKRYRDKKRAEKRVTRDASQGGVTRHRATVPNQTVPNQTVHNQTNVGNDSPASRTDCLPATPLSVAETDKLGETVREVVAFFNLTCGTEYRSNGAKTREKIIARLNEGFALDDFKTVILKKHADWGNNPDMTKYLRPETLFGAKFESYLNQPDAAPKGHNPYFAMLEGGQ